MRKHQQSKASRRNFRLDDMPPAEQRLMLERFLQSLISYFDASEQDSGKDKGDVNKGKKKIMSQLGGDGAPKPSARQFDVFLKRLYKDGYLRVGYHRRLDRAETLKKQFGLQDVIVVAGQEPDFFFQAAAEAFIQRMFEIGRAKKADGKPLFVGIVSGSTTGDVIRAAMQINWRDHLGFVATDLPDVRVFALNVCLTIPEHLAGNATILAYQLADKINREAEITNPKGPRKADAYGLSAPLMVRDGEMRDVDQAPQTVDVLRFTEPSRVDGQREGITEQSTDLDIVLTGVGQLPLAVSRTASRSGTDGSEKGSIFYELAKQFIPNMDEIVRKEHIVGDIAFSPIRLDGSPIILKRKRKQSDQLGPAGALGATMGGSGAKGESSPMLSPCQPSGGAEGASPTAGAHSPNEEQEECVSFYSAVRLPVLEEMAKSGGKSVILVARHEEGKFKIPAIFASVAGEQHKYVSRLIIDDKTAQELARY